MKLKVFYSWQSDLPNKDNRQFIQNCLEKAMKNIHSNDTSISDYTIESDSREECGTPELASAIFAKIDQCDVLIADISIINYEQNTRKVCNPNVLIELGYASAKLGWEQILCVYNCKYGKIEDLPFDIRHRKPLIFNHEKELLTKSLTSQIQSIIENHISSKKYFSSIKREIDLSLQAILIDLTKIIFFGDQKKKNAYNLILHFTKDELLKELFEKSILGFQLFKDNLPHLTEFIDFYNNQVYLNFLNDREKRTLAKIILQFKDLQKIIADKEIYEQGKLDKSLGIIDAHKLNPENPQQSYILTKKMINGKGIVMDSGTFKKSQIPSLTYQHKIKVDFVDFVADKIFELAIEIREWISITGNYFIFNTRPLD